ncbi:MAG: dTMP kinase [Burkholderiales bacterium]
MSRGKFISLEGIDGAGKSTHVVYLANLVRSLEQPLVVTREPGGTPLGEKLRALVLSEPMHAETETLLMFAARREHIERVISPALERGDWVVSDRFTDASYAYQGGGRNVSQQKLQQIEAWTVADLAPDLTLLFDLDPTIAKNRQSNAGIIPDRFEQEQQAFFKGVRNKYLERAASFPQRIKVLDASMPIAVIQEQIKTLVFALVAETK